MAGLTVIGGSASAGLAEALAGRLGARLVRSEVRVFADGESKVTLDRPPGRGPAVVVQSTPPPVDANMLQALALVHRAAESSGDVTAVVPYMGYARQDRAFLRGELVTMAAVADLFRGAGARRAVVVDIHSAAALARFRIPAADVSAVPALAARFARMRLRDPLAVSPDAGAAGRAAEFARLLGADHAALDKSRDRRTGRVSIADSAVRAAGRDAIIVDDMVSTGGSVAAAAALLRRRGARRVLVACTHALLAGGARARMRRAGVAAVVGTNTVPGPAGTVDVSGEIAGALTGRRRGARRGLGARGRRHV